MFAARRIDMAQSQPIRMLYVEDDPAAARLLQRRLSREGYQVDLAGDGAQGLAMFEDAPYDVVAVDQDMPRVTGLEMIRTLAARGPMPPTIMVTGAGNETIAVEALKLGAVDYIIKDSEGRYLDLVPTVSERALAKKRLLDEKKRTEAALKESEELHRITLSSISDAVLITDDQGALTFVCPNISIIFGYSEKEVSDMGNIAWLLGDDLIDADVLLAKGEIPNVERRIIDKNGGEHYLLITVKKVSIKGGTILYTCRDITERRHAEDALKTSLKEKSVLLGEIHHRVKNNLAVIVSLMDMQSRYSAGRNLEDVMGSIQRRVRSMAIAHEILHRSESLANLNIPLYIGSLVRHLRDSFRPVCSPIEVEQEIDPVSMGLDTAIPLGFLVTELVSNCLKHAFRDGRAGKVRVLLHTVGEGGFELVVSDNGVGMPTHIDWRNPASMGLELIDIFVRQLGGGISLARDAGTDVRIRFSEA